jgi:RNA polymerase sigma-70 factor (ECF subfamily)
MESNGDSRTSQTLLGRVKQNPTDQEAWEAFDRRYGLKIYGWCRQYQLQHADAEEVRQEVLTFLVRKMRTFEYDPTKSFRGWLRTVTINAVKDFQETRKKQVKLGMSDSGGQLENAEAHEDLARQLAEEFDLEVLELAMERVRQRVEPQTWKAYWLLTKEQLKPMEVAVRLNMQKARVYEAKNRVKELLKAEIKLLSGEEVP